MEENTNLCVYCYITVVFFLLAGLAQRKKLSKIDAVLEDAAIKSAGIDTKFIPRIIIAHACFIIFLILFKISKVTNKGYGGHY